MGLFQFQKDEFANAFVMLCESGMEGRSGAKGSLQYAAHNVHGRFIEGKMPLRRDRIRSFTEPSNFMFSNKYWSFPPLVKISKIFFQQF